jgi:hypothetical protein
MHDEFRGEIDWATQTATPTEDQQARNQRIVDAHGGRLAVGGVFYPPQEPA